MRRRDWFRKCIKRIYGTRGSGVLVISSPATLAKEYHIYEYLFTDLIVKCVYTIAIFGSGFRIHVVVSDSPIYS